MSFQCVKPPKDAEGREIPLSTKELYHLDGTKSEVACFSYWKNGHKWTVILCDLFGNHATSDFLLYPPDSWEQLEHDATLAPRDYLQARGLEEHKRRAHSHNDGGFGQPRQGAGGKGETK